MAKILKKPKGKAAPVAAKVAKKSSRKGAGAAKKPKAGAKDPVKAAAGRKGAPRKGDPRRGGRQPGTPNKRTLELREALEAAGMDENTHPVIQMFKVYTGEITMPVVVRHNDGEETWNEVENLPLEPGLRVACMKEVAQYLEPKRKAIELSNSDGEPLQIVLLKLDELEPSGVGVE